MAKFILNVNYIKFENLILVNKIKFDDKPECYHFNPDHQLLCLHLIKIRNVPKFKNFRTISVVLNREEFEKYYDFDSLRFRFLNTFLLSERESNSQSQKESSKFIYHINNCQECNVDEVKSKLSIRKRSKLKLNECIRLSHDIGIGYSNKDLMNQYSISKETLRKFKIKLRNDFKFEKIKKEKRFTSLSLNQRVDIIKHIESNPFLTINQILRDLKLNCSR